MGSVSYGLPRLFRRRIVPGVAERLRRIRTVDIGGEEMRVVLIGGIEGHERGQSFQTGYAVYSPFGLCPALLANGLKSGLGGILILARKR